MNEDVTSLTRYTGETELELIENRSWVLARRIQSQLPELVPNIVLNALIKVLACNMVMYNGDWEKVYLILKEMEGQKEEFLLMNKHKIERPKE